MEKLGLVKSFGLVLVAACAGIGCGRYGDPIPPELLAPKNVEELRAEPLADGVTLAWKAAEQDRRGKELKSSSGYRVMRRDLVKVVNKASEEDLEFVELAFIPDDHVEVREKLRDEAREAGKVGRRLKAPPEKLQFSYTDKDLKSGKSYLYRIVPVNQGDEEGLIKQVVRVNFAGTESSIAIENADSYDAIGDDEELNKQ